MQECLETDVLIIGCGIAGIVSALTLAKKGLRITIITSSQKPDESNTKYAQGGIIYKGEKDSPLLLAKDILNAGSYLNNQSAVDILTKQGPLLVEEILIKDAKISFDLQDNSHNLSLAREGGHLVNRIAHVNDTTGAVIENRLLKKLKSFPNVSILAKVTAVDLLTPSHNSLNRKRIYEPISCIGAYVLDQNSSKVNRILAKYTILATGGLGQVYLYTTNPNGARGDGIAMANRAGARSINLEYIQFHPTALVCNNAPRFLISEAVRGEGARLVNENGVTFMQKYDSKLQDLSTRDVVARGIYRQMITNGSTNMYLDLKSYISTDKIKKHFPNILKVCLDYGIDITQENIPVAPAAHYSCGGIWVNDWGETTINNLYAVGEVACTGLHGANRLASTSLLEGLVYGHRAGVNILGMIVGKSMPKKSEIPSWHKQGSDVADPVLIAQDLSMIRNIMWNYVGLIRKTSLLQRAIRDLVGLEEEIEHFYRGVIVTDSLIGLRNTVRTSILISQAAWENKQSIGCHYRE